MRFIGPRRYVRRDTVIIDRELRRKAGFLSQATAADVCERLNWGRLSSEEVIWRKPSRRRA